MEIASNFGRIGEGLGADLEYGKGLLEQVEPFVTGNIPILFKMARAWRDMGEDHHALMLLEQASVASPSDAYSRLFQEQAVALQGHLMANQ